MEKILVLVILMFAIVLVFVLVTQYVHVILTYVVVKHTVIVKAIRFALVRLQQLVLVISSVQQ